MIEKNALEIHLGTDFEKLDAIVKSAHLGEISLQGYIEVIRGNFLASALCNILKLPKAGCKVWNTVKAYHYADHMRWERTFDGQGFNSCFNLSGEYLIESMGPLKLYLKGSVEHGSLIYRMSYVKFLGITIPEFISPDLYAIESENSGKYKFLVKVSMPLIGTLIQYSGTVDLVKGQP